jgi:hypothetical protein
MPDPNRKEPLMRESLLLTIDAAVNLALGLALLVFPAGLPHWLGLPTADPPFFASLLGAVLAGIGLALLAERFRARFGAAGLGIGGALLINFCGAGALVVWLVSRRLALPTRGAMILWTVAIVVLALGLLEMVHGIGRRRQREKP